MPTRTATGSSMLSNTTSAATEATRVAVAELARAGASASFAFVFCGSRHRLEAAMAAVREGTGGADTIGCTTAGEITERGLTKGGVAVMLVAAEAMSWDLASAGSVKAAHERASEALCARFGEAAAAAKGRGYVASTTVMLVDGLAGTGEKLVSSIMKSTRSYHQVVGGAAGDDGQFQATWVSASGAGGARAALSGGTDAAAALHLFGANPVGVGVDHGLFPSTGKMTVTRAAGNVIHEIDGRPAFETYRRFARERGVELTREGAGPFLIKHEIGVYFLSRLAHARAPLSVGVDGSLACAAPVSEGASVAILDGRRDELVTAAKNAAEEAREHLQGRPAAGVLLFDCICRGAILDKDFPRELDAVRAVFPGVPVAGFLTYGEIARYRGRMEGWHNSTAVVAALPA